MYTTFEKYIFNVYVHICKKFPKFSTQFTGYLFQYTRKRIAWNYALKLWYYPNLVDGKGISNKLWGYRKIWVSDPIYWGAAIITLKCPYHIQKSSFFRATFKSMSLFSRPFDVTHAVERFSRTGKVQLQDLFRKRRGKRAAIQQDNIQNFLV